MYRIDSLDPMTSVILAFDGRQERATFHSLIGDKKNPQRRALFESKDEQGKAYKWEAYRYQGRWAYGTGAGRLTLVDKDCGQEL